MKGRRRIERIESTNEEDGNTGDRNNASADKELEVKRRIDLMKGSAGRNEPGTIVASKTDKQNSKTRNTPVTGRGVAKHRRNGVGQTRGKQVSKRQHQVQKIRSRGRQIPSRVGETEKKEKNKRPLKIKASRETSDSGRRFRIKTKSHLKASDKSGETPTSEPDERTEKLIIRVPKIGLDISKDDLSEKEGENLKESNNEMIGDEDKNDREHSLNFLSNFLQTYNQNLNTKTTNVINPSEKEQDTVLGDILSSNHEMVLSTTEKIIKGEEISTIQIAKKQNDKSGKRDETHKGENTDKEHKLFRGNSGKRRGQKKDHRQNSKIPKIETKQVTRSQVPVFRSNKRTHSKLENDISTELALNRTKEDSNMSRNITDKNKTETATTAPLEINPSNLFLSRFMGIQRTKRPDKAPAKVNNKIDTNTKVPTKSVAKYPLRHRFSPVVTKPVLSTDYPEEERANINNDIPKSQAISIKATQSIRGIKSKFSRKSFRPHKSFGNSDQESESKENKSTPDNKKINLMTAEKQPYHSGRVVPNQRSKSGIGFDNAVVEKTDQIETLEKKKSGEDDNKRFAGRLSSKRKINRGRSSFNRGRGSINRVSDNFSSEENVIESSSTSRTA